MLVTERGFEPLTFGLLGRKEEFRNTLIFCLVSRFYK